MFQYDPDGKLIKYVLELRSLSPVAVPDLSPIREDDEDKEGSKTFELETPREKTARHQKDIVDRCIDNEDHPITEFERHPLELYAHVRGLV